MRSAVVEAGGRRGRRPAVPSERLELLSHVPPEPRPRDAGPQRGASTMLGSLIETIDVTVPVNGTKGKPFGLAGRLALPAPRRGS